MKKMKNIGGQNSGHFMYVPLLHLSKRKELGGNLLFAELTEHGAKMLIVVGSTIEQAYNIGRDAGVDFVLIRDGVDVTLLQNDGTIRGALSAPPFDEEEWRERYGTRGQSVPGEADSPDDNTAIEF